MAEGRTERTLVIGLGNPILGDDSVGWRVAEQVADRVQDSAVEVDCLALGGLRLMERMIGYDRVILIDAIVTGVSEPGHVSRFPLEALPNDWSGHSASSHDVTLRAALEVGRAMGARLPEQVVVVAVEAGGSLDFAEDLSPAVAAAVPRAVEQVLAAIRAHRPSNAGAG